MSHRLLAILCILYLHATSAAAQSIPFEDIAGTGWNTTNAGGRIIDTGDYVKAEIQFHEWGHPATPALPGDQLPADVLWSYCGLARVLYHQGRSAEAEPLAEWAGSSVREADKKASDDAVFQALYTLSLIHSAQQHFAEAEPLLKRALALQEKVPPPPATSIPSVTLDQLALVYRERGESTRRPEPLYIRAVAIHERKTPDENLDLADTADQYARLCFAR